MFCYHVTGNQKKYYWIGALQIPNARGPFRWYNKAGSVSSGLFNTGEPNQVDKVNRQCVNVGVAAQKYNMNDYPCRAPLPFICERGKDYSFSYT